MSDESRRRAAEAVLRAHGFTTAVVTIAGHDRSIAVIADVAPERLPELARLAAELKGTGFRYVTLELKEGDS